MTFDPTLHAALDGAIGLLLAVARRIERDAPEPPDPAADRARAERAALAAQLAALPDSGAFELPAIAATAADDARLAAAVLTPLPTADPAPEPPPPPPPIVTYEFPPLSELGGFGVALALGAMSVCLWADDAAVRGAITLSATQQAQLTHALGYRALRDELVRLAAAERDTVTVT